MLVCPQCQFDNNPDSNKFCQQCGTSLTHKPCPECGTQVSYNAQKCHNCGFFTGTVWWAIVSGKSVPLAATSNGETQADKDLLAITNQLVEVSAPEPTLVESTAPAVATTKSEPDNLQVIWSDDEHLTQTAESAQTQAVYLDPQKRYQLLEPAVLEEVKGEVALRVLDCQPLQASPLEFLQAQQGKGEAETEVSSPAIPAIAKAYLELEQQLYPAMPKIHDAWIADTEVILLEDRSTWPLLIDLWRDDEISYLHLLHLLHEMASWWKALSGWNCRQSLLEFANLRVDEDQALGLQRLYLEPQDCPPTLQALGKTWQELLHQSERTIFGPLGKMLVELQEDKIQTIDELRSRIEAIAREYQADPTPPTVMLFSDPDLNSTAVSTKIQALEHSGNSGDGDDMPTVVLPMQLLSLEDGGRTDVGRQRRHNEDFFGIQTRLSKQESPFGRTVEARGLYVLCDGMGGHAGGEVASALAVDKLSNYFKDRWKDNLPDEECIRDAVLQANQAIFNVNQQDARSGSGRMGTTLVMVLVQDTQVAVAHVGDSRLYRISRRQGLEQVTVDHEVGQREIKRGVPPEIAYTRPDAYQLTQALGPRNEHLVVPDIQFFELNEDTLLLLCSDGLSDNDLIENNWSTHLKPYLSSRSNLEQGVSELIELANQYNGHDNITAVLIRAKVRPDLEQAKAVSS